MVGTSISRWLLRFARKQVIFLLVASAIVAVFWAITGQTPSLLVTLIYTFVLGNSTALGLENIRIPCSQRWSMLVYLGLLLAIIPFAVTLATAIIFVAVPQSLLSPGPHNSFWVFLLTGWKFPVVASVIFGGGFWAYIATRNRLEDRNRQLQQTLESNRVEHELDATELQQAHDIQRGFLPKEIPQLPEFAIAGAWEPAREVGGDYYDVIRLSKDRLAICIADVAGKGVSAALLMANVQAAVRAFASENILPSRVVAQINSVLYTNTAPEKFVTLFYGVLDARTRTLQYTNAGHPRPLIIHSSGKTTRLENGGALLGVFFDWAYEDSVVELEPGDLLLLFTDGITEAAAPGGEEFGEERLIAAATIPNERTLEDLQSHVLSEVKDFCQSQLSDDATLLMIAAAVATPDERNAALIHDKSASEILQYAGVSS
jgi:sigma-B regulation protein RsbU (phosphoserine phosphatase)